MNPQRYYEKLVKEHGVARFIFPQTIRNEAEQTAERVLSRLNLQLSPEMRARMISDYADYRAASPDASLKEKRLEEVMAVTGDNLSPEDRALMLNSNTMRM